MSDNFKALLLNQDGENFTREQTQEEILNTAENTVVYFK